MRNVAVSQIEEAVCRLCVQANRYLPQDLCRRIEQAAAAEDAALSADIMHDLCDNMQIAAETGLPICQDTGMAVVFIRLGQEVHLTDGLLADAVNRGVARGYVEGKLRCSVVGDPLRRVNTGDNTPAVLHLEMVAGDKVEITVAPKGFGSENMSRICMMKPSAKPEAVVDFICETARLAGSNACPPMMLGVGIGGDFEQCALLAKKALCRAVDESNADPYYADMERRALEAVNALGIGPQGFGGRTTALGVNIEWAPTHIAGLPVAVNVGCHVTRHASEII